MFSEAERRAGDASADSLAHRLFRGTTSWLSADEYVALRRLLSEFRTSHYHRVGLRRLKRMSWSRPLRINLGSGPHLKEGYLNIDSLPGADLTLDIRRGLPFESNCCEMIFSEHCFEHIDYPSPVSHVFRECLRVLKPGGRLRLSVPDTEWPLVDYSKGAEAAYFQACIEHPWHPDYCSTRLEHINYHFRQDSGHRYAYDEETLGKALAAAGFVDIRRVTFDPGIDSKHREIGSLFMVASKPEVGQSAAAPRER